jgi:hypothetical protein
MIERPHFGACIAAISTSWTFSEDMWGVILSAMLGIQSEAGLAMYHSLIGTGAQRSVLNEMAERYLGPELQAVFRCLMRTMKGRAKERNDIVHGLWFHDPKMENSFVLAPRNSASLLWGSGQSKILGALLRGEPLVDLDAPPSLDGWLVYNIQDLADVVHRLNDFMTDQDDLFDRILAARGLPPFGPPARPPRSES